MSLVGFVTKLDAKLEGTPNYVLTASLILAGIFAWIIAFFASPTIKTAVLAWMVFP